MSLKLLKAKIAYNYAKLKASQLYRLKGMQQFILITDDSRLLVMDKSVFYRLRNNKNMPNYIQPLCFHVFRFGILNVSNMERSSRQCRLIR